MVLTKTIQAYAKINLFLDITGRRPDGYHTIAGIMHTVSLCDLVTVSAQTVPSGGGMTLTCSHPALPTDAGNLGYRAATAWLTAAGMDPETVKVSIHIDKHIPFAAGMAGGSADAAAVLRGLNDLLGNPLTAGELSAVGLKLGADVPFCLAGGAQVTEGIGEVLTPCPCLPACDILIACAGEGVSTPAAYRALDGLYGGFDPAVYAPHRAPLRKLLAGMRADDPSERFSAVGAYAFNLFESVILPQHATARMLKARMEVAGAVSTMISARAPPVSGLFSPPPGAPSAEPSVAQALCDRLNGEGIPAWVCHPVEAENR